MSKVVGAEYPKAVSKLFGENTIQRLASGERFENFDAALEIVQNWHRDFYEGSLRSDNETSREQAFNQQFFVQILGYVQKPAPVYTFEPKASTASGQMPDARIGFFDSSNSLDKTIAVVELKGASVSLDKPQKGHGNLSPVQQGFKYKPQFRGCEFVIVSNFFETRLYNDNMLDFESWTLDDLVNPEDDHVNLRVFCFLLSQKNLVSEHGESNTKSLLLETRTKQELIGKKFYSDYREARSALLRDLWLKNASVKEDPESAIEKAQKLIDRVVFSCFAEDAGFIPEATLSNVLKESQASSFGTLWGTLKTFFEAVDVGSSKLGIPVGFNGGLFAKDRDLDELLISDEPLRKLLRLGEYDFQEDLSVTILGHIFEQSITDLEELRTEARSGADLAAATHSKRKKDGIFYTPDYVVRAIVENSLGVYLRGIETDCIKAAGLRDDLTDANFQKRQITAYNSYLNRLQEIKVIDPSCGSGAFLVAAYDYLLAENYRVNEILGTHLFQRDDVLKPILQNNLFGVDLNEESVEITKLSLWLRSATRDQKLTSLDANIRCGNSLVSEPDVEPEKAFDWNEQFKRVFNNGGFDVVVGNPPYVQSHVMVKSNPVEREYITKNYISAQGNWDLYVPFYQKAFDLLRPGGICSMIVPNKILISDYASHLRKYISERGALLRLIDVSTKGIFEVDVYPVIISTGKGMSQGLVEVMNELDGEPQLKPIGPQDLHWGLLLSENEAETDLALTTRFDSVFDVYTSSTVDEGYKLKPLLTENANARAGRLINTGTIDPYIHYWGIWPMKYLKLTFVSPVAPTKVANGTKAWHKLDKAIIAGMANTIEACFTEGDEFFPAIPTVVVTAKADSKISALVALAILNSEPFRQRFISSNRLNAMAGGYMTVTRGNIGESQIPAAIEKNAARLEEVALTAHEAAGTLRELSLKLKDLFQSEYGNEAWTTRLKGWWEFDFPKFVKAFGVSLSLEQKNALMDVFRDFAARGLSASTVMVSAQGEINALVAELYSGKHDK